MTGLLIIFVAFAFGMAGGFLAVHFYFNHHYFVTMEKFHEVMARIVDCIQDGSKVNDALVAQINDLRSQLEDQKKKMNEHYYWSLGIWNSIANFKESVENPIPETLQEVAREEVQLGEEDVKPMGPIEDVVRMLKDDAIESLDKDLVQMIRSDGIEPTEMQAVKEGDPIDIKIPDQVKPLRRDKKKKGKKNAI